MFFGSFNKIIEVLDHVHPLVATPSGSDRMKQVVAYKAPIIVNGLFAEQPENDKEVIKECWGDDEKADNANKIYVKFLEKVKREVKKRLSEEFAEISDYIEKDVVENLKYIELLSPNLTNTSLTNTSIDYDHKQEMRKKYQIEVKGVSEISI